MTWIRPHSTDSNYLSMNHYPSLNTAPCSFQISLTLCVWKKKKGTFAEIIPRSQDFAGRCGMDTRQRTDIRGTENCYHFLTSFYDFLHISKRQSETESDLRSKWKQKPKNVNYFTMATVVILTLYFLLSWSWHATRKWAQAMRCNFGVLNSHSEKCFSENF